MKKLLVLLAAFIIILSSCSSPGQSGGTGAGLAEGNSPPDFTLKNIDGKDVKLSDYKGKTVILNFFGVWCPWCVKEMPDFVKVYNEYKNKNVELVVIDVGDTKSKLLSYLQSNNFSIKPLIDDREEVSGRYLINSYPTTYIIDGKGVTRKVHMGYMDEGTLRSILDSL